MPDVVVVGFQELALHLSSFLLEDPWTRMVDRVLAPWGFVRIKQHRMQGILLLMYCKRNLVPEIRGLQSTQTKTGLSQFVGSKGAVSISCKISGVSFVLTCAHLSAHQEKFDNRVRDYATIVDEQVFNNDLQANHILSHDYGIFMGDLNFRINNLTELEVHEKSTRIFSTPGNRMKVVKELLEDDQLGIAMREGVAFSEYCEPDITFMPTFKFIVGSNQYDLLRKPSWTDRILYRFTANAYENELPALRLNLSPLKYCSHPGYLISDHKPVSALFLFSAFNRKAYENTNLSEPSKIAFLPLSGWRNGDENCVWFTLTSKSRNLTSDDYVAIYRSNFLSLAEEIHRSYVNLRQETSVSPPRVRESLSHVHDTSWFKVTFHENVLLEPSVYCFLYISSRFNDVFSISPPFDVH